LKGLGEGVSFCEWSEKFPNGPLFMPVKNGRKTNIDTFANDSKAKLMEVLIRTDTDYVCRAEVLQSLKSKKCNLWYNALFDAISAKHTESKDAVNSWDWFVKHDAKVIQTDYPFELLQYLINKNLHEKPQGFKPVDLNDLPEMKNVKDTLLDSFLYSEEKEQMYKIKSQNFITDSKYANKKNQKVKNKKYHKVRPGETISKIAKTYNISLAKLIELNPRISKRKNLKGGTKIRVL
jgi:LysM repeat protein